MANNEQIRKLIRQIVREEVQALLPGLLSEVFTGLIAENVQRPTQRRPLQEASYMQEDEMDEYPTMQSKRTPVDRARMATLLGYGDGVAPQRAANNLIVSSAITEHGTEIPVDPNTLPDHVVRALTRNYSDVMQTINAKKNNG